MSPLGAQRTPSRQSLGRRISAVAFAVGMLVTSTGCSQVATAPAGECSPEYSVGGAEGALTVRQAGKGEAIAWGIYVAPEYKTGLTWNVKVYAGGVKVDEKSQITNRTAA